MTPVLRRSVDDQINCAMPNYLCCTKKALTVTLRSKNLTKLAKYDAL